MSKIAIVYWSGTGNTEAMAQAIAMGVKKAGGDASVFNVNQFTVDDMADFSGFLFGCPAMGAEELEEAEFEPFFQQAETKLAGKPVGLFGSYGWGGGEWMKIWQERTAGTGAKLIADGLIVENGPTDSDKADSEELGRKMAEAVG